MGTENLAEALPLEMARVRDELLPEYDALGAPGVFAAAVLRHDLDDASRALASGDVVAMLRAYEALRDAQ